MTPRRTAYAQRTDYVYWKSCRSSFVRESNKIVFCDERVKRKVIKYAPMRALESARRHRDTFWVGSAEIIFSNKIRIINSFIVHTIIIIITCNRGIKRLELLTSSCYRVQRDTFARDVYIIIVIKGYLKYIACAFLVFVYYMRRIPLNARYNTLLIFFYGSHRFFFPSSGDFCYDYNDHVTGFDFTETISAIRGGLGGAKRPQI